ncbi:ATP-dependent zinc metalloprotease FtsH [Ruminococcus sp. FMB-CY1]|uniref:ATP-dependent zinc metalloprotease FtsH n=2 Tax=Ruminococcus TaxID=1263 RepID=UPI0022F37C6A|nr:MULTISPECIES: ATP-dependent zinc metalloprotease FtsH [unclassified Ruminococcus]WBX56563.1 ATP-dependent zinc metalloprotease FtsH [Ruminococcus sp. FMB-CY1]
MDKKLRNIIIYITVAVMVVLGVAFLMTKNSSESYSTSQLVNLFKEDKVQSYTVNYGTGAIEITLKEGVKLKPAKDIATSDSIIQDTTDDNITATDPDGKNAKSSAKNVVVRGTLADIERFIDDVSVYTASADEAVSYDYIKGSDNTLLYEFLPILVTGILFVVVWIFIMKKMGGGLGGKEMNFGKAKIKNTNDEKRKTTFEDVAGADEEKEELEEIVEFLKAPDKYNKLGARIPKGVLLVGPPGTGKTLLARAVAGEAGVPFFSISGSDFVEMFVGVGASRVRDLFEQAKKNSPCIIFIDEIDAVGRQRGAGLGGGHDEREQTLNQLLVEMDGFGANEGVILIAATNRPDVLDPALMRPGRFDRQVIVSYPDINGREAILKVHARKKPLAPDVKLKTIAKTTAGFTGADLENLLNEAALLAARKNKKAITMEEIEEATIKVVVGAEKKTRVMSDKEKKLTAYHEAGHAICFHELATQDPVHEISIIPRGMAGGYTMPLPSEDKSYNSRTEMLEDIVVCLGGRVAEAIILDDISTGASNDIEKATKTARDMVTKYGMTKELGCICYGKDNSAVFLGRDMGHTQDYSERTAAKIDELILEIVNNAYDRAETILKDNIDKLHEVAAYLIKHEKMGGEDFEAVMNGTYVEPVEAEDAESEEDNANTAENKDNE